MPSAGDELWFGEVLYLPQGFFASLEGDGQGLLRLDNWGTQSPDNGFEENRTYLTVLAFGPNPQGLNPGPNKVRLSVQRFYPDGSAPQVPLVDFSLPEGSPLYLDVHVKLSTTDVEAFTEVYVNGASVGASYKPNYRDPYDRARYGMPSVSSAQSKAVNLYLDTPYMSPTKPAWIGTTPPTTTNVAPTVQITAPVDGSTVIGRRLHIHADAADDKAVARVEFYIDGGWIATDTSAPYETSIRTRRLASGTHRIAATAFDAEGLFASDSVTVTK